MTAGLALLILLTASATAQNVIADPARGQRPEPQEQGPAPGAVGGAIGGRRVAWV